MTRKPLAANHLASCGSYIHIVCVSYICLFHLCSIRYSRVRGNIGSDHRNIANLHGTTNLGSPWVKSKLGSPRLNLHRIFFCVNVNWKSGRTWVKCVWRTRRGKSNHSLMWEKPLKIANDNRSNYCELHYRIKAPLVRELFLMLYQFRKNASQSRKKCYGWRRWSLCTFFSSIIHTPSLHCSCILYCANPGLPQVQFTLQIT